VGLDLVVEGCPRRGHEAEWREILERSFSGDEPRETDQSRFNEISVPPHERVGAPRVGFDDAADAWIVRTSNASTPDEVARVLTEFHGYYVLRLVESDGIPKFSNAGLYEGVDKTSFRGAFLSDCKNVLTTELIDEAWSHKFPEDALSYGHALLAAAESASKRPEPKQSLFSKLGITKAADSIPMEEQLEIVRAAGKWFIYWAERGHAIRAWF
jgi:hypothetical protein